MYQPRRIPRSEYVPIRHLEYHVLVWGEPGPAKVPMVMVHGWMDVAASYQFVVDAFTQDHYVIAPDWRGYGLTQSPGADNYWFPDYLADLDFLLDHYSPHHPVHLVGHSMGGNVAMLYAGSRPQRVRRLVNLEGFGMPATHPAQAPKRYAHWMDELKRFHRGELDLKRYESVSGVASRLMKTNKRLTQDKADWLARHWARPDADGMWRILGDPAHKIINAQLYRVDEVVEIYRSISAPTLDVQSSEDNLSHWWKGKYTLAEYRERVRAVINLHDAVVEDSGHMLHHDQPEKLATLLEEFFVTI
jgi:pimeloyl-ACP methyl ester carboxylesterase